MSAENTIQMFDASLQRECDHTVDIDGNGEVVLTSVESGRFVKLPKGTDADGVRAYIAAHRSANEGQVTQEMIEEQKAAILAGLKL